MGASTELTTNMHVEKKECRMSASGITGNALQNGLVTSFGSLEASQYSCGFTQQTLKAVFDFRTRRNQNQKILSLDWFWHVAN